MSQIKTFLQCPRQYHLRYVEKVRPEFRSAALAFGTAWHHALSYFFGKPLADAMPSVDDMVSIFRAALEHELTGSDIPVLFDDDESSTDGLVDKAREMLDVFVRDYRRPDRVIGIEEPFLLELAHPVTGEILALPLVGAMDALVDRDGKVIVTELKSSKRRWGPDQLEQDIQATAYRMAARSLGHDDAEVELVVTTKSKKPDVQVERLIRHRGDEHELAELAFGVVKAVRAGLDHRNRGWQCRGCAYAGACAV